ncbi:MAG: DUF2878 family protein [Hyphomicrobiaceae bacterium]|nr:DUF2878 family protein [Hyphomicrobiaceae bacterium]
MSYLKLVLFQGVWAACALGAAQGRAGIGLAAALGLVLLHVAIAPRPGRTLATVAAAAVLGFAAETAMVSAGAIKYATAWPDDHAAPAWVIGLWAAFATTSDSARRLLGAHALGKAALLGLVLAPASYLAGARLGALTLPVPAWSGLVVVAAVWAIAYPLLLALEPRERTAAD